MKPTCHPTARDREFAADLYAVLKKLAREGKPVPLDAPQSRPSHPRQRPTKKPRQQ